MPHIRKTRDNFITTIEKHCHIQCVGRLKICVVVIARLMVYYGYRRSFSFLL